MWWKFLRDHPLPGVGLAVGPFITLLGFAMDGYHLLTLGLPPVALQGLGAFIFFISIIGILYKWWITDQIPIMGVSGKAPKIPHGPNRSVISPWWGVVSLSALLIATNIIWIVHEFMRASPDISGNNITRLVIANAFFFPPGVQKPQGACPGILVNVRTENAGDEIISSMTHNYIFEYPDRLLTRDEEEKFMKIVDSGTLAPTAGGIDVLPHSSKEWFSVYDKKFTEADWSYVMAGNTLVYLFVELKYLVSSHIQVTEWCVMLTKNFPSVHDCIGHNRAFAQPSP